MSSRRSVLAGNIGRWASHWPGILQGMLQRHCRPQLTHVHTYFQIHTPSTMHAFHEPGRLWRNNGGKWEMRAVWRKWELCSRSGQHQKTVSNFLAFFTINWFCSIHYLQNTISSFCTFLHLYISTSSFPCYSCHFLCFLWIEEAEECCTGRTLILLRHSFLFPHQFPWLLGHFLSLWLICHFSGHFDNDSDYL